MKKALFCIVITIIALISLIFSGVPVMAAATIALSPVSGSPGTSVTVTGTGFSANEFGIGVTFDETQVASASANALGNWSCTFVVPAAESGLHNITALGTRTVDAPIVTFDVTPIIKLNKTSGSSGGSVTVKGSGFVADEEINVTFDGEPLGDILLADSRGAWTGTFTVPSAASGNHTIDAYGDSTADTSVEDVTFNINVSFSISQTSGSPGTTISVDGSGFAADETGIVVTFDGSPVGSEITADDTGGWSLTFSVPASSAGSHVLDAYGDTTQAAKVPNLNFTVAAGIFASSNSGPSGTVIDINGAGFGANETGITVSYNGAALVPGITADASGAWYASITIPDSPAGTQTIDAFGPVTRAANVPNIAFTVSPSVSMDPTSGHPGTSVSIKGSGFAANEKTIVVTYDNIRVVSNATANAQGAWIATFTVPDSSAGTHIVDVSGSVTKAVASPDLTFYNGASISLGKASGIPGSTIAVKGGGFGANESGITLTYDGGATTSNITANNLGEWSASFVVPLSIGGIHSIEAFGPATTEGTVTPLDFSVLPTISINPTSGNVGTKVSIKGSGFNSGIPVQVEYDGTEFNEVEIVTDDNGTFKHTITIPKSAAGFHEIRIIDFQNSDLKASFNMDSIPPSAPRLFSPGDGNRLGILQKDSIDFKWIGVTDPSGVTYTLQVDNNPGFSQPLLEKAGITINTYTPTSVEALKSGNYYWRVKAVDGASNESDWSQAWVIESGLFPFWALAVIIIIVILAIAGGVTFGLRRRKASALEPEPAVATGTLEIIPGEWRTIKTPSSPRILPSSSRLALPQSTKSSKTFAPEKQARLKVVANFAKSLPLMEPSYDARWLLELVDTNGNLPLSPATRKQILDGSLIPRYDPAWLHHPLYADMIEILGNQPAMQTLDGFVESVNLCALESSLLMREIYRDTIAEVSSDLLGDHDWDFVSTIYSDAMSWFLGKSLQEPSERDYAIKFDSDDGAKAGKLWLWDAESSSFNVPLVAVSKEEEVARLRGVHIKLRRSYRTSNRARQIVELITQLEVQRTGLSNAFEQFATAMS